MNQKHDNPEIYWKILNNKEYLYFNFHGTLTGSEASEAVQKWKDLLSRKNEKKELIWNCVDMKGYEPMARNIWQRTLKEFKTRIDKIWLISDSTMIQAGAKIISMFTSFEIKNIHSEDELA